MGPGHTHIRCVDQVVYRDQNKQNPKVFNLSEVLYACPHDLRAQHYCPDVGDGSQKGETADHYLLVLTVTCETGIRHQE